MSYWVRLCWHKANRNWPWVPLYKRRTSCASSKFYGKGIITCRQLPCQDRTVTRRERSVARGLERTGAPAFMNNPEIMANQISSKPRTESKMHLSSVAVCGFSKNCACVEAATEVWRAVYMNRKRFGVESNCIYRIEPNRPAEGVQTGGFLSLAGW